MDICNRYHDEIVFDSKKCPLCEALDKLQLEEELSSKLQSMIGD